MKGVGCSLCITWLQFCVQSLYIKTQKPKKKLKTC